jgi:hypothetical protein
MLHCRGNGGEMTATKSSSKAGAEAGAEGVAGSSSMTNMQKATPGRKRKGSGGRGTQKGMSSSSSRVGVAAGVCGRGRCSLATLTCKMPR